MKRTLLWLVVAGLGLFFITGCAKTVSAPEPVVTPPAISVEITAGNCPSVEVTPGMQVAWTNRDTAAHIVRHEPAAGGNVAFDSGELGSGDSFVFTFTEPGQYPYRCAEDAVTLGMVTVGE